MKLAERQRRFITAVQDTALPENVAKHLVRRGSSSEKVRLLRKTDGACEGCDSSLPDPEMMHVHHVTPISRGGTNEHRNVTLLCPNCHAIAHWLDRTLTEPLSGRRDLIIRLHGDLPGRPASPNWAER